MSRPDLAGRVATFRFATHPPITGKITWVPAATGDCWHVTRPENDFEPAAEFAIQQFDYLELEPE